MRKTFYFGKSGKKVTEKDKKYWTENIGNNLIMKNGRYKIISVKFQEDLIEVIGERIR